MPNYSAALMAGLILATGATAVNAAKKRSPLVVKRKAMNPVRLSGQGGPVYLRLLVNKRRSTIYQVRAQGSVAGGGAGPYANLTRKGKFWEGSVSVPRNPATKPNTGTIAVFVTSDAGTEERILARVKMLPGSDFYPPKPPQG